MIIKYGDIFKSKCDMLAITTNGYTKVGEPHEAVMGRGMALRVKEKHPEIPAILGDLIRKNGNVVQPINDKYLSFPVKPTNIKSLKSLDQVVSHAQHLYKIGGTVPGFHTKADISIIKRSAEQLRDYLDDKDITVALGRPGVGAGELKWSDVYPVIKDILPYKVHVYTFKAPLEISNSLMISGSRSITHLNDEVKQALDNVIAKDLHVRVGDCYGVDTEVQEYLWLAGYPNVTVYHIGDKPRINIGYPTKRIDGNRYTDKDRAMVNESRYQLCIWDGESKGTLRNIRSAKGKRIKVIEYKL